MFLESLYKNQTKLIEYQLISKGNFDTKISFKIGQHLSDKKTKINILESKILLDLFFNYKSGFSLKKNKHRKEFIHNYIYLKNKNLYRFFILSQLFLVPELRKNAYDLKYNKKVDKMIYINNLNLKLTRNIPSNYYNWIGNFYLKCNNNKNNKIIILFLLYCKIII